MTQFAHDSIKPFSEEGSKKTQVSEMFDGIAPRYDFMNRFLSAGIDKSWRRKAIRRFKKDAPPEPPGRGHGYRRHGYYGGQDAQT